MPEFDQLLRDTFERHAADAPDVSGLLGDLHAHRHATRRRWIQRAAIAVSVAAALVAGVVALPPAREQGISDPIDAPVVVQTLPSTDPHVTAATIAVRTLADGAESRADGTATGPPESSASFIDRAIAYWHASTRQLGEFRGFVAAERLPTAGRTTVVVHVSYDLGEPVALLTFADSLIPASVRLIGMAPLDREARADGAQLANSLVTDLARSRFESVSRRLQPVGRRPPSAAELGATWTAWTRMHGEFQRFLDYAAWDRTPDGETTTVLIEMARHVGVVRITVDARGQVIGLMLLEPDQL